MIRIIKTRNRPRSGVQRQQNNYRAGELLGFLQKGKMSIGVRKFSVTQRRRSFPIKDFLRKKGMLKFERFDKRDAQIMVEYSLVIGLVIVMLVSMLPILTRMTQSMVKVVADQVGNQANSDQEFGKTGHLVSEYASTRSNTNKYLDQQADVITYRYDDRTTTLKTSLLNLGTIPAPDPR